MDTCGDKKKELFSSLKVGFDAVGEYLRAYYGGVDPAVIFDEASGNVKARAGLFDREDVAAITITEQFSLLGPVVVTKIDGQYNAAINRDTINHFLYNLISICDEVGVSVLMISIPEGSTYVASILNRYEGHVMDVTDEWSSEKRKLYIMNLSASHEMLDVVPNVVDKSTLVFPLKAAKPEQPKPKAALPTIDEILSNPCSEVAKVEEVSVAEPIVAVWEAEADPTFVAKILEEIDDGTKE